MLFCHNITYVKTTAILACCQKILRHVNDFCVCRMLCRPVTWCRKMQHVQLRNSEKLSQVLLDHHVQIPLHGDIWSLTLVSCHLSTKFAINQSFFRDFKLNLDDGNLASFSLFAYISNTELAHMAYKSRQSWNPVILQHRLTKLG